jgi:putative ABC transport system permease protein
MTLVDSTRHALRLPGRNPLFTAVVVVTLALGIGANTAIFSVAHAILLRPLPYAEPDQLYMAEIAVPERFESGTMAADIRDVTEWRQAKTAFADITSMSPAEWNLSGGDEPERIGGAIVSSNLLSFLGVRVAAGRDFVAADAEPGRNAVAIISDGLWRRRFGSDPGIIGRRVGLNGLVHTIVGVAPPSLLVPTGHVLGLTFAPRVDVWTPLVPSEFEAQGYNYNHVVLVRVDQRDTLAQGGRQLEAMLNAPGKLPPDRQPWRVVLTPIRALYSGDVELRLLLLFGATSVLLLIACSNLANLFLARATSRSVEMATRLVMGATRAHVVAQTLAESTFACLIGGALGVWMAYAGLRVLVVYGASELGPLVESRLQIEAVLFAVMMSLFAGIASGILPALRVTRGQIQGVLAKGATSIGHAGAFGPLRLLVGVQMALATVLLFSGGLLLHSFVNALAVDRGYDVTRMASVDLSLSGPRYATAAQRTTFYRDLTERISALPGVAAAGAISEIPATGVDSASQTVFLDSDTDAQSVMMQRPVAGFRIVTPGYAAASGSRVLAGRFFSADDPVSTAVVSESLARRLWPGEPMSSIPGRLIRQGAILPQVPPLAVIGVLADVRAGAVTRELKPQLYRLHLLNRASARMSIVIRATQEPAALAESLRAEIKRADAGLPIPAIQTMEEIVSDSMARQRFQVVLTALFALVALCLGAGGVYGVVSYAVAARTRDIGLRMALGALKGHVRAWVLSTILAPVVAGLVGGILISAAAATAFQSVLFGVGAIDLPSMAAVTLILLGTSLLACYIPARRAVRLNPIAALRHD